MATITEAKIALRDMTSVDLEGAIELSQEHSWPHRHEDWELYWELGEGLVATANDRIVGTIMAWRYGDDFASLGMVIVKEGLDRNAIAGRLMEAIMERLDGRSILLNATQIGLPLYASLGFVPCGVIHQHEGPAPSVPLPELQPLERVRPMGQADEALAEMYSRANGMDRGYLFDALARDGKTVVLSRDHEPVGFAMSRPFGRGRSIAPIVAPDLEGAKVLVSHWMGTRAGRFCRIDVVEGLGLSRWLENMGLPKYDSMTTMVRGRVSSI